MNTRLRMLDFALLCLWRHKWRHGATFVLYGAVVFVFGSVLLLAAALKHEAQLLLAAAPEVIVQRLVAGRHDWVPLAHAAEVTRIRGVASVTPRFWGYYYDPLCGGTYTMMGVDALPLTGTQLVEGRGYGAGAPWACVIGQSVAEARLLEPDDILPVKGIDGALYALRVTDVFSSDTSVLTHDLVLLRIDAWRQAFGVPPGVATDLAVHVPNPREADTVIRKIAERLPDTRVIGRGSILMTYEAVFGWRGSLVMLALAGAVAAFGILSCDRAWSLGTEERRTLGVLKAVGWSVSDVLRIKLWEGLSLSLMAFGTGVLAAHVHVFHLGGCVLAPLLKGWSVLFPELRPEPHGELFQLVILFLLAVVPYLLATLVPAWTAAALDPDRILRD